MTQKPGILSYARSALSVPVIARFYKERNH